MDYFPRAERNSFVGHEQNGGQCRHLRITRSLSAALAPSHHSHQIKQDDFILRVRSPAWFRSRDENKTLCFR